MSISSKDRKFVEVFSALSKYFLEIAASFDQLGNAVFGGFLQWFFVSKTATSFYEFGDKDETVSEVLGWNQQLNALSKTGIIIVNLLDWLDKDHCKRAMYVGIKKAHLKIHVSNGIL